MLRYKQIKNLFTVLLGDKNTIRGHLSAANDYGLYSGAARRNPLYKNVTDQEFDTIFNL
jgi:hypothetical protein